MIFLLEISEDDNKLYFQPVFGEKNGNLGYFEKRVYTHQFFFFLSKRLYITTIIDQVKWADSPAKLGTYQTVIFI